MKIKDYNNTIVEVEDEILTIFGSVDNLNIESSKDFNIKIWNDIWITNDFKNIKYVSLDNITDDIGILTKGYLQTAKIFAYKTLSKKEIDIDFELTEFINVINSSFSFFLWLVKDNDVQIREAFFIWSYTSSKASVDYHYKTNQDKEAIYNLDDIKYTISIFEKFMNQVKIKYIPPDEPPLKKQDKKDRFSRAIYLITHLRTVNDLSIRISIICSILELFFSTDNSEITHKLAERIAFLLSKNAEKRISIYNTIKEAYTIRSKISHGDIIPSRTLYEKILSIAESCDSILRTIMISYIYISEFSEIINYTDTSKKTKYFEEIIFGIKESPLYDNEIFEIKFNEE